MLPNHPQQPNRPGKFLRVVAIIITFTLAFLFFNLLVVIIDALLPHDTPDYLHNTVTAVALAAIITAGLLWFAAKKQGIGFLFRAWTWPQIGWSVLTYIITRVGATVLLFVVLLVAFVVTGVQEEFVSDQFTNLVGDGEVLPHPVLLFIILVVIVPIWEEILFRGYLYCQLRHHYGFIFVTVVTSIVFALLHLDAGYGWLANIVVFFQILSLSLGLSYIMEKTKNLWMTIMIHGLHNAFATLVIILTQY